jgi:branched-chain amino acid transport system substrate-binding protein
MVAAIAFVFAACSSSKKTSSATGGTNTTAASGGTSGAWKVDTSKCPAEVNTKITGTVKVGTTMALSGGAAAGAFAPVAAGFKAFVQHANDTNLIPGVKLELVVEDDQYNANLTTAATERLLDQKAVNLIAGQIGTPNGLAVRDTLNRDCIPQLLGNSGSPAYGQAKKYPWTTGALIPYNTETAVYLEDIKGQFPNGAKTALFYTNNDFGQVYKDTLTKLAPSAKLEIVDQQTIEATESNPPKSQVTSIAAKRPDVIIAAPLGTQCPAFLKELANAKATTSGWKPRVYITSTCASTLLLALSGTAAEGVVTVVAGKDPSDPKNAADPAVKEFKAAMAATGFSPTGDFPTASAGWAVGVVLAEILKQAAASSDGLTRASIINAQRNMSGFHPPLARDGLNITTKGTEDPYLVESMQVVQYSATTKTYTDIGPLHTEFEGKTEQPA